MLKESIMLRADERVEPEQDGESMGTCLICMEECARNFRTLQCGHVFHAGCITRWSHEPRALCPTCRGPIQ